MYFLLLTLKQLYSTYNNLSKFVGVHAWKLFPPQTQKRNKI